MARLESIANAHYFPTSERVSRMIGTWISNSLPEPPRILDPCAGAGEAVSAFAEAIGGLRRPRVYAVELDAGRAMECESEKRAYRTLQGDFFDLVAVPSSFDVVFLNPPYHAGLGERQEITWFRKSITLLKQTGLMVGIVPGSIFRNSEFLHLLTRFRRDLKIYKFPEEETQYDQYAIIGTKRSDHGYGYTNDPWDPKTLNLDVKLPSNAWIRLNDGYRSKMWSFKIVEEEIDPPSLVEGTGVYGTAKWLNLTANPEIRFTSPLVQPRQGHQAMLLAAGAINGERLGDTIVKGHAFKTVSERTEEIPSEDGEESTTKETATEVLNTQISTLNVKTGEFDSWLIQDDPDRARDWFNAHSDILIESVRRRFIPQFDGDCGPWADELAKINAPGILPGHEKAEILPVQKEAACANAYYWRNHKATLLSGEMGVGKTLISITSHAISGHEKVVVICPGHLVKKWTAEADRALGVKCSMIGKKFVDIDRFFSDPDRRFLILSKEKAKLGTRWRPVYAEKKVWAYDGKLVRSNHWACPRCHSKLDHDTCDALAAGKVQQHCDDCGESLFEYTALNAKGTKRWPLASYLVQRYARRYSLIVDECHQYASAVTSQSRAVTRLGVASKKALFMTGTLYGGRASSVFQLLYRIDPTFRLVYPYNGVDKFSATFGFFEEVTTTKEGANVYGRSAKPKTKVREIPGMNPAMIPIILPYTNFVKLRDLELDLPPYTEHVHRVPMDPSVSSNYHEFVAEIKSAIRTYPQVLSQYLQAALGWPDRPDQSECIEATVEGTEERVHISSVEGMTPDTYPKDDLVVRLCEEEIADGGKCIIFMTQTHRRDARTRVAERLRSKGINVEILDVNVAPDKRIPWVDKKLDSGMQVLITNGKLVETGMDLIFASTIIQYGIEYSVHTLRQSVRRSWRLGQTRPVNVHYVAYEDSIQGAALDLISQKMRAAEAIDGDDIGGLGETARSDSDFFMELAKAAIKQRAAAAAA